ncbi:tail fiber domain-containing protein [Nocardia vinacea]|uniref:tail fiber domain-containing protein n=1 Tax=Nocardia vinacea TaxID=96468 RepID=UPI000310DA5E|nr:tail fiber domain-containing protein [Nocardia vinacea]
MSEPTLGHPMNGHDVLGEVVKLPISTWRYEWEPPDVRHLGPMAQDWKAAFGLGDSDKVIYNVDASGVALVCIQALQRQIVELRAEIDRLRDRAQHQDLDAESATAT